MLEYITKSKKGQGIKNVNKCFVLIMRKGQFRYFSPKN